MSFEVEG